MIGYFKTVKAGIQGDSGVQRIINKKEIINFGVDNVSYNSDAITEAQETLAEKIANGEYVEPYNWKNNTESNATKEGKGYLKIGSDEITNPEKSKYFWVEELKNWCTYRVWAGCPLTLSGVLWTVTIKVNGITTTFTWTFTKSDGEYGDASKTINQEFINKHKEDVYNKIKTMTFDDSIKAAEALPIKQSADSSNCSFNAQVNATEKGYNDSIVFENGGWVTHPERSYFKDVGETALQLCVWNGIDAFVPINSFIIDSGYKEVAVLQNQIIGYRAALNGKIVKHRGSYCYNASQDLCTKYNGNPQWYFSYDPNASLNGLYKGQSWYQSPISILHALILETNKNYSIYDKTSFQCRRLGKPYYAYYANKSDTIQDRSGFYIAKDRAAVRQGMSTGNPGVFRTATGELALATMLVYGGVIWLYGEHGNGFDTAPINFLNDICKEFFGDGLNKTCAQHWLKINDNINTNDEMPSGDIQTLYETSLDKTLNPQMDKTTEDNLSMSLTTEDVAVEIEEEKKPDYAVKW